MQLDKSSWKEGVAPLHLAAAIGRTDIMEMLIEAGCKVNR
jgi:ankyrin repeat protein